MTVLLCRKIWQFFFIKWWTKGNILKIINLYASFMKFSEHSWSNVRCDFVCQPGRNFTPWISVCHIADFAAFLTINWLDQKTWNRKNDAKRSELKIHGCQVLTQPMYGLTLSLVFLGLIRKPEKGQKKRPHCLSQLPRMWPLCKGKIKAKSDPHFCGICSFPVASLDEVLWKLFSSCRMIYLSLL